MTWHPATQPIAGDIWRGNNDWERHVLSATPWSVTYLQVVHGRENVRRNCLAVVWHRWCAERKAVLIQRAKL